MLVANHSSASDGLVVKVIDFGLARNVAASDGKHPGFSGTPGFASPEQLSGNGLDARSDIYSLGATLYYALTGAVPPSNGGIAKIPPPLRKLLDAMLAKDPAARPLSAKNLLAAIERCQQRLALVRQRRRWLIAAAVFLLCSVVAMVGTARYSGLRLAKKEKLPLSEKSIAVLPFENPDNDKESATLASAEAMAFVCLATRFLLSQAFRLIAVTITFPFPCR